MNTSHRTPSTQPRRLRRRVGIAALAAGLVAAWKSLHIVAAEGNGVTARNLNAHE